MAFSSVAMGLECPEGLKGVDTEKLQGRVVELLHDEEEMAGLGDTLPDKRPGSITPLGVRVDRGQGLLSTASATATLSEMDSAISGIRQWHQKRDRDLAAMLARNTAALDEAYQPVQHSHSEDEEEAEYNLSLDPSPRDDPAAAHTNGTSPAPWSIRAAQDVTTPSTSAAANGQALPAVGSSAAEHEASHSQNRAQTNGQGGQIRSQADGAGGPVAVAPTASGRAGGEGRLGFVGQLRTSTGAAASTAARERAPQAAAVGAVGAEQSALMQQLERELQELDQAIDKPDSNVAWHADVESALARLDALQTGYQVADPPH